MKDYVLKIDKLFDNIIFSETSADSSFTVIVLIKERRLCSV